MTDSNRENQPDKINKQYILVVSTLTFVVPIIGFGAESVMQNTALTFELFGKWFIFSAVGLRLFLAGLRQTITPAFTAKEIFHLEDKSSFPIVRELGFANLCFGLLGFFSIFITQWRTASAFSSGFYYGLAGILQLVKKPVGINEQFALWTDLVIFILLLIYFVKTI